MKLRNRQTGSELELAADSVLGRSSDCSLVVADPSVSRRHARFELRSGTIWAVDLGSSNGLHLNGRRSTEFALRPGDLLTVGAVAFDVIGDAPPSPADESGAAAAPAPRRAEPTPAESRPAPPSLADEERSRLRAEIKAARRSRGLGDLGQQPLFVQILAVALGLALLAGLFLGVRWLGHLIAPH